MAVVISSYLPRDQCSALIVFISLRPTNFIFNFAQSWPPWYFKWMEVWQYLSLQLGLWPWDTSNHRRYTSHLLRVQNNNIRSNFYLAFPIFCIIRHTAIIPVYSQFMKHQLTEQLQKLLSWADCNFVTGILSLKVSGCLDVNYCRHPTRS